MDSRVDQCVDSILEADKRCRQIAACLDDAATSLVDLVEDGYQSPLLGQARDALRVAQETNAVQGKRIAVGLWVARMLQTGESA